MMINAYAAIKQGAQLEPYQYDPSPLGVDQVEIDVESCGICHSDLSMLNNDWQMTQYPFVPGHEVIGRISAVGDGAKPWKVGQRVGLGWNSSFCLHCYHCHQGDHNLCTEAEGTIIGRHGGFADKVRAQSNAIVSLPEGINADSAGPLFCAGITVFNPLVQFNIPPTAKVGVIGIGGLGHLALQFLHAWGCKVTAFTHSERKRNEALELGADDVLNSADPGALASAADQFDLILSTVNVDMEWSAYIQTLAPKGRLHFVGASLAPLNISIFPLISGQRSVSGSPVGSPSTISTMLQFANHHSIQPVIETFFFDQVNEAIERLHSGQAHYRIVLKHRDKSLV